jgi:hypothetical protein
MMGYHTLQDILAEKPGVIFTQEGFDYNWLGELSKFLSKHQLLYLLQPLPGKSAQ